MKFASVPVANALGHLLAHATAGRKKGHTLTREDIEFLVASGISHVTTASLDPEDVHEDQAAASISAALNGANCTLSPAHTGRVNILAAAPGLAIVHADTVDRINAIHESITLATLRPFERIESRQMLATVKIIPFSAPQWAVRKAGQLARVGPLSVAPFVSKRIALISTSVPGMKQALLEKTRAVLDQRVRALGSNIISEQRVTHDASAIAGAISECMATQPDILLIMGASAITDRADSVPAGIIDAGGTIEHFGMPVDPGNLLLLAEIRGTPVIGVPGCARSPKLNGLDFVLQRICAGVPMTAADIKVMGVGGLLKEIPTRPHPREKQTSVAPGHHIEAIVLAAGRSTRMGSQNKLLLPLQGVPMIQRTVNAVLSSRVSGTTIVTGHNADAIEAALKGMRVNIARNPDFATGMASSLRTGLSAIGHDASAVLVCLGDMPAVSAADIDRLISAFDPEAGRTIIVPTVWGKRGNPILFGRQFFEEMSASTGDTGARALLNAYPEAIYEVEMESAAVLADADTPAAFEALQAEFGK